MIDVIVVGEGQTEETFVREVLAPELASADIRVDPRLIETSPHARGGALSPGRVMRFLRNTLRERRGTFVTTFFDLYRLGHDFPGVEDARARRDPLERCRVIESALAAVAVEASGCRADRFLAHIQPFEFEALLFSDPSAFATVQSEWQRFVHELQKARNDAESPEHINDGPNTHPSRRLETLLRPRYKKTLHGIRVAASIGLPRIRQECRHFDAWLARIESLKPLG